MSPHSKTTTNVVRGALERDAFMNELGTQVRLSHEEQHMHLPRRQTYRKEGDGVHPAKSGKSTLCPVQSISSLLNAKEILRRLRRAVATKTKGREQKDDDVLDLCEVFTSGSSDCLEYAIPVALKTGVENHSYNDTTEEDDKYGPSVVAANFQIQKINGNASGKSNEGKPTKRR